MIKASLIAGLLLCAASAFPQTPAISRVVNAAVGDARFAPTSIVYIYGTFPANAAVRDYSITVGGTTGPIAVANSTGYLTAQIPYSAAVGPTDLVVSYKGQNSAGYRLKLAAYAPEFLSETVLAFPISGPVFPLPDYYPFLHSSDNSRVTVTSPARAGEELIVRLTGLGPSNPPPPAGISFGFFPLVTTPSIDIGGKSAQVVRAGIAGLDEVVFTVPADIADGYHKVVLDIAGVDSNPAFLPVGNVTVPSIAPNGVIAASDFGGTSTVAAGSYIEIYGSSLSPSTRPWTAADFTALAPTALDGVSVTVGGRPAFVSYVSPSQVNALVPSDVPPGRADVVVTSPAGPSSPASINVVPLQPRFLAPVAFRLNGKQFLSVQNPDGTVALPAGAVPGVASRPARVGETVVFYGTGFGPVSPSFDAGTVVTQLNTLNAFLEIYFGFAQATVSYAGLAPGLTGVYQFNVVVPPVADYPAMPIMFHLGSISVMDAGAVPIHQ